MFKIFGSYKSLSGLSIYYDHRCVLELGYQRALAMSVSRGALDIGVKPGVNCVGVSALGENPPKSKKIVG
jgi:hypothetical protein